MAVRDEIAKSKAQDNLYIRPSSGEPGVTEHQDIGRTITPESLAEDLTCSPTFESLKSQGLKIVFDRENLLASFLPAEGLIKIGGGLVNLLHQVRPDSSKSRSSELILEVMGRRILARQLLAHSLHEWPSVGEPENGFWEKWFSIRPILSAVRKRECSFDEPFVQMLLSSLLEAEAINALARLLPLRQSYQDLLFTSRLAIRGGESDDEERFRAIEERRFVPPAGSRIAYFRQSADGFILPVFDSTGDFRFISKYNSSRLSRQVKAHRIRTSGLLLSAEYFESGFSPDDLRHSYQVPLEIREGDSISKNFGPYFKPLPGTLKEVLSGQSFFVTTAGARHQDEVAASSLEGYSLLMYGAPMRLPDGRTWTTGRTGVLFSKGLPVIVELEGFQYLLEVKGAGSPDGGYPLLAQRSSHSWSLLGGLRRSYAEDEFASLCEQDRDVRSDGPCVKPVCLMHIETGELIEDPVVSSTISHRLKLSEYAAEIRHQLWFELGQEQSILLRLTPAVERLSYLPWTNAFAREDTAQIRSIRSLGGLSVERRISCYGLMVARLLRDRRGHLSSHIENILAGSFGAAWQDYADMLDLYVSRGHYADASCLDRRYLTLCVLNHTFYYVARTAKLFYGSFGVGYREFSQLFYTAFAGELQDEGVIDGETARQLNQAQEPLRVADGRGITEFLWEECLALDNYLWCVENYDLPAAIFGPARARHPAGGTIPASKLAPVFLRSEIAFLTRARVIAERQTGHRHQQLSAELAENLSVAEQGLERAQESNEAGVPLLPYLRKSDAAPRPRKPLSWNP